MADDITFHTLTVTDEERAKLHKQRPAVIWLTGLSASGKSTVANALDRLLCDRGCGSYILDGDNVRCGLSRDLGFTWADRTENVRRVREVAKLMRAAGLFVLVPLISPYRADRDEVRRSLPDGAFVEVYVRASVAACEERDPKGLYAKARRGEIKSFTGVSEDSPYEPPLSPELELDAAGGETPDKLAHQVLKMLEDRGHFRSSPPGPPFEWSAFFYRVRDFVILGPMFLLGCYFVLALLVGMSHFFWTGFPRNPADCPGVSDRYDLGPFPIAAVLARSYCRFKKWPTGY